MTDAATASDRIEEPPRRRFALEETGFKEVPKKWRRFYRHWQGAGDVLAPNEVICPVCNRSAMKHGTVWEHAVEGAFVFTELFSLCGSLPKGTVRCGTSGRRWTTRIWTPFLLLRPTTGIR